jgi:hypothetical protein
MIVIPELLLPKPETGNNKFNRKKCGKGKNTF